MTNGRNTCACPDPPGGYATCGADEIAICRIKGGKVVAECIPRLASLLSSPSHYLANWLLQTLAGTRRPGDHEITTDDLEMLQISRHLAGDQAELVDAEGDRVTFRLPLALAERLRDLDEGLGKAMATDAIFSR